MKKYINLLLISCCVSAFTLQAEPTMTIDSDPANQTLDPTIEAIKSDGNQVNISLNNPMSFPILSQRYELNIGDSKFFKSFYKNGNLNKLTFILSLEEFNGLADDSIVTITNGLVNYPLGTLNKSILIHTK
ncbi:hypothetical protein [Spartinivicinus poritis]|uniref:Uncharacterized protein n=1 Tax=Spartinivicinus poritis TaxID=2994640 RepID=A0ABT5UGD1_9GAMM|nr:hypothetical protein [Spartinivicinus sp. A2-2]MDE1464129.1 hypothetical protein [Spartinivicinus sp. A2-2]